MIVEMVRTSPLCRTTIELNNHRRLHHRVCHRADKRRTTTIASNIRQESGQLLRSLSKHRQTLETTIASNIKQENKNLRRGERSDCWRWWKNRRCGVEKLALVHAD
ncbi:hypothetical protein Fot_51167 [Forsythia ovata]|uniref:Uncharacterized protein n=1 Tax=Forsythia ovata TaxID=205694 RepID=A0ABD1PUN2_9LAMI